MIGFNTIRKHQAWLWWIIATITIVSFVALGPSGCNDIRLNGLKGATGYGMVGTHAITQTDLQQARAEVLLRYFLSNQHWPTDKSDLNIEREMYIRVFLVQKEKEFGIQVGPASLAEYARHILGQARLDQFVDQILKPQGLTEDDFERFLTHEVGAQQLVTVAGLSGKLVTPGEAEALYRDEHQELVCSLALLSASNYMSGVTVTEDALKAFYTNRMSVYREPARVEVNYVKFNVTNYWAKSVKMLTNVDAIVAADVKALGTNLFRHTTTAEESRAALKDFVIRTNALLLASHDAQSFALEVYNMQPTKPENIQTLAAKKNLTVSTTAPFDELQGPTNMDVPYQFPKIAFELSAEEPFGQAVTAEDGVYVLGFKKKYDSYVPPLDAVKARVTGDYRYYEGLQVAQQTGLKDYTALTNGLAQGKSFDAVAAELLLKTQTLPPFSLETQKLPEAIEEKVSLAALRQVAFSTPVGYVSPLARAQHGVFLVYVEKKLPVDEAKMKEELPGFLAYMRQARQADAFNEWFSAQVRQDPAFVAVIQRVSEQPQMRAGGRRQN